MTTKNYLLNVLTLLILAVIAPGAAMSQDQVWQAKVEPLLLANAAQGETEFLVFLKQQADLSAAENLHNKTEKGAYVYTQLTDIARRTQPDIINSLQAQRVDHQPYWVANMIRVRGDAQLVENLARRPDVARLYNNPKVRIENSPQEPIFADKSPITPDETTGVEWNIAHVRAPEVWAMGYYGQEVIIGGADTGYQWDHPALINQYRGWDGASVNHDYNWHDAIHSGDGGVCGLDSPEPCDDWWHGTHTMGTMVGDDGGSNQVGMAPGAKWIGCRNMGNGYGTPATYSECFQWFIAPWPAGGDPFDDGDPGKAPHAINNSWGCSVSEGCTEADVLLAVHQSVRAAGILNVTSTGNTGSSCGTVDRPPQIYDESFSVGSTNYKDSISYFSSRGPATFGGEVYLNYKPDISAPGEDIRSSTINSSYIASSGTSMAAPHVSGLAALLISAKPELAGQVDLIETLITRNASERTSSETCGGVPGDEVPNNTYGWGVIDAIATVQNSIYPFEIHKSASNHWLPTGQTLTYTIVITLNYPVEMTNIVISDTLPANVGFIKASEPYTLAEDTLQWPLASLSPGEGHSLQLVVDVPASDGIWQIVNQDYGVHSAEASSIVYGDPVTVTVAKGFLFLPSIYKGKPDTGLTLLLHLDEPSGATIFSDSSGFEYHGTCQGDTCPTAGVEGASGSALRFDGVNDFVEVQHNSSFDDIETNDKATIAAWVKIIDWYNNWFLIANKYEASNDGGYHFCLTPTLIDAFGSACITAIPRNVWRHLAVSYDRSVETIRFYLNGEMKCENHSRNDIPDTYGEPLYIGFDPTGGDEYSNGLIDELLIYDRALSTEEIALIYQGTPINP